jgi:hypothetical protein
MKVIVLLGLVGLVATACSRKNLDARPAPPAAPSVVASPVIAPPPPPPIGKNLPAAEPTPTLFGRMEDELKHRPDVHPSVDDAFLALAKRGVPITDPQQSLATTYKAAFCRHGVTGTREMSVLLCEYADEAHTAVGLAESNTLFPALTTRHSYARKTLLMVTTLLAKSVTSEAREAEKTVVATFDAL